MAVAKRGLGRGLDALLGGQGAGSASSAQGRGNVRELALDSIRANPKQPRQEFTEQALEELAESIRSQGVLQPILVRPIDGEKDRYELVAGERRWRAAGLAGLAVIPAMVRTLTDEESLAIALIENLQREDLNPIEEAKGYARLLQEFGVNQDELAKMMGKSRSSVANCVRLLKLPDSVQRDIQDGKLSAGHGRALMSIDAPEAMALLHEKIVAHSLSVRQAEADAAYFKEHGELPRGQALAPDVGAAAKSESPAQRSKSREPKVLDQDLARMRDDLDQMLGARVRVTGNLERGSISFHYKNQKQLEELVERLGMEGLVSPASN